ncbi:MAG: tetratricopeptide repeat protein [Bacteroidota bacterium]
MKTTIKKPIIEKKKELKKEKIWFEHQNMLLFLLVAITLLVYIKVVTLGFTRFDDSIFIIENQQYNKDLSNIFHSFGRGLFNPENDIYYRPVFLVDFILESRLFDQNPAGYHFTNLIFHVVCVVLLFFFFKAIGLRKVDSFFLSLIFALHPVLCQAVAWIPGRNDMILMIFFLAGVLISLKYVEHMTWYLLLFQGIALLLALFTKETSVIIPVITLSFIIFLKKASWRIWLPLLASWILAVAIWWLVRAHATLMNQNFTVWELVQNGFGRLPAFIQYLGKIFFPFNLSVYPGIGHITIWWGLLALGLLIFMVIISKSYFKPLTIIGVIWFVLFLLPVLVVPASLNDQVFEHRLYIPIVGILLILSQTKLFEPKLFPYFKPLLACFILLLYSSITLVRIGYFKDPLTFWDHAVRDNPSSSYANMMLGLRQTDSTEMKRCFMNAYSLNPDEKMLNYFIGRIELDAGNIQDAEFHLKRELKFSNIPDNYFNLAKVYFVRNKPDSAAWCLERVIETDPLHPQANYNLSLLYLQLNRKADAFKLIETMKINGLEIPVEFREIVK